MGWIKGKTSGLSAADALAFKLLSQGTGAGGPKNRTQSHRSPGPGSLTARQLSTWKVPFPWIVRKGMFLYDATGHQRFWIIESLQDAYCGKTFLLAKALVHRDAGSKAVFLCCLPRLLRFALPTR